LGKIKKIPFLVIMLTFALSSLSATIIFPILAPLFLGSSEGILRAEIPENIRSILFGVFLAAFPLAQFIFSPLIGEYSDRTGRKKVFILTLILEVIGYFLSGIGIHYRHLSLLFIGRFITGLGAANFSVCLAALADISYDEKSKARYFSYGSAIAGVMFVLGPFVGGRLSDPALSPIFNFAFPLWIGTALSFLNLLLIVFVFKNSLSRAGKTFIDPIKALHNVEGAFQNIPIQSLYIIFFFFLFAWNMLYQFLPALLVEEFGAKSSLIGDLTALMGIVWFAGTMTISFLMRHSNHQKIILLFSSLLFGLFVILIPIPNNLYHFVLIASSAVFFAGGIWPVLMGTISRAANKTDQGKTLGISQSIQSLAMLLAPFFGGFFFQANSQIPFIFASSSMAVAFFFLVKIKGDTFKV